MGTHTILRERDDGDFDHVEVNNKTGAETVIGVVAAADKDFPWGRISDEEQSEHMRMLRDDLLTETDWWASSDLTMTAAQTAYRQALRDITSHANWPFLNSDDWPTKP